MNQQLSTFFTAIQTERDNRDLALARDWTAGSAREENHKAKSVKTLISLRKRLARRRRLMRWRFATLERARPTRPRSPTA
jgi:hypothetical protein